MSKPYIHSLSSAKKFGGKFEDYIEIHSFLDSSKGAFPKQSHRALTHNSWFLSTVLERIKFKNSHEAAHGFFPTIINSDGKHISVRDIGEQHILEDFRGKILPTAEDYLKHLVIQDWMNNGGKESSKQEALELIKKEMEPYYDKIIKNKDIVIPSKKKYPEDPTVWPQIID